MYYGDIRLGNLPLRSAPIVGLYFPVYPSAIFMAVRAVIVDAINRVFCGGARPHVGKESLKGPIPSVAHANSSPAVIRPVPAVFVSASLSHVAPSDPLGADLGFSSHSVRGLDLGVELGSKAPATRAVSVSQGCPVNKFFDAAVAQASPVPWGSVIQDSPSSELPPGHFDECRHNMKFTT